VADFVFNISKGRVIELFNRVDVDDPAASTLTIIPVDVAAVSDATIKDFDDFAAIIAGGVTERAASNWNRKTLTQADITMPAPNDANDSYDIDLADIIWTPGPTAGAVTDIIICYASVASPTNAQLLPLTQQDFAITPDGSDVTGVVNALGWFRAS
jgi:hypothetical protein